MEDDPLTELVRVVIPNAALMRVFDECDRYDADETGGRLLGVYQQRGDALTIEVNGVIEPGPNARRTATSFFQDGDYQTRVFREVEELHPEIEHLGSWHTHHVNGYPTLSGGDRTTYQRMVNHAQHNTDFFYALLVVERRRTRDPLARYRTRHFLLYRGDETVYEIPEHQVQLVDKPLNWPVAAAEYAETAGTIPTKPVDLAYEQGAMRAAYPEMQPFLSRQSQTVSWKGPIELVDGTRVTLRVVQYDGSFHVMVKDTPKSWGSSIEALAEVAFAHAALSVVHTERALNRLAHAGPSKG